MPPKVGLGDLLQHLAEHHLARPQEEHARVEAQREPAPVRVDVADGRERIGQREELVEVAQDECVGVEVDRALRPELLPDLPQAELRVLVDEVWVDALAAPGWSDPCDGVRLEPGRGGDTEPPRGDFLGHVEHDATRRCVCTGEGRAEHCDGGGELVREERRRDQVFVPIEWVWVVRCILVNKRNVVSGGEISQRRVRNATKGQGGERKERGTPCYRARGSRMVGRS